MSSAPQIGFWLEPDNGGVCCVAGVTWPNGHYSEFRSTVGCACSKPIVGVSFGLSAQQLQQAKRDADSGLTGTLKGPHMSYRLVDLHADYLKALQHPAFAKQFPTWEAYKLFASHNDDGAHSFPGLVRDTFKKVEAKNWAADPVLRKIWPNFEDYWAWFLRNPIHTTHPSALKQLGQAFKTIAEVAAPQLLNLIVPGAGVALSAALIASEAIASGDPKKAFAAASQAAQAAGVDIPISDDEAAIATSLQQTKAKIDDAAGKLHAAKNAATAAKAKTVATVSNALKNPTTRAALQRAGVDGAAISRASAMFDGVRNGVAAAASAQKGDHAAAAAYNAAAEANAHAAQVPPASITDGGRKLYYLALTTS